MKHWKWIASTGLVAVLAIAYVTAEPERQQGKDRVRADGNPLGPIFQLFDGDGNGEVTRAELAQADAAFDTLDSNKDGVLSRADFPQRERGPRGGGMLAARLAKAADADRSGDVTAAEWQKLVASIETDADGAIVPESLHAVLGVERPVRDGHGPDGDRTAPTAEDLTELFSKLDRDDSGVLEATELTFERHPRSGRDGRRGPGGMHDPGSLGPMSRGDGDASGDISAAEWQTLFGEMDRNSDGTLTADELRPDGPGRGMRHEGRGARQK